MTTARDFTLTLTFDASPDAVFAAVNDVRGWWSRDLQGASAKVGDEFTYRHEDIHRSTHRVIASVPGSHVAWRTLDAELRHASDPKEWIGTEIRFDIARVGDQTELRFTHVGLVPELHCFTSCVRGWTYYVGESLRSLIATGRGKPDSIAKARVA